MYIIVVCKCAPAKFVFSSEEVNFVIEILIQIEADSIKKLKIKSVQLDLQVAITN